MTLLTELFNLGTRLSSVQFQSLRNRCRKIIPQSINTRNSSQVTLKQIRNTRYFTQSNNSFSFYKTKKSGSKSKWFNPSSTQNNYEDDCKASFVKYLIADLKESPYCIQVFLEAACNHGLYRLRHNPRELIKSQIGLQNK